MEDRLVLAPAIRKMMVRILPFIMLGYVIAYVDRVNISFAAIQMNVDLGFSATVYGLGAGLFFLSYGLFEVPSSMLMERVGPKRWLVRIMLTWGAIATAMMFVETPIQFYIMRFMLGVAEAGFFPTIMFYLSGWFPAAYRGRAISWVYIAPPVASILMGAVSGWLLELDGLGNLHGWQWLFLVQGLPGVVLAIVIWRFLPESPAEVGWLSVAEKEQLGVALSSDASLVVEHSRHDLLGALTNPVVLLLGFIGLFGNLSAVGLILSAPAVLTDAAAMDTISIGYLVSGSGILGTLLILAAGWNSDRHGDRLLDAIILAVVCVTGLLALAWSPSPWLAMGGYLFFAVCTFPVGLLCVSSAPDLLSVRQLAVGVAAINTFWQMGSFASPYLTGIARDATGDYSAGLYAAALAGLCQVALMVYLRQRVRIARAARILMVAAESLGSDKAPQ
ncbi:MFS transporter [Erythrobacter dokdonensis]|uniref:D-galactonate transporter n=1 Tax=Erythrobacter dokdonensis DSW-74 TaxID=1300349 RepID=A0A1A7BFU5_9SPHN|nr:MFS transporter [Erythrobacter dokdonensis]OBV11354.1 D-galactonate transporter [Erythrobacter dokdonensis DSW-74]